MKFFTMNNVVWRFLLVKIKDYLNMSEEDKAQYKEILIDPGVYDLTKGSTFSWEEEIDIDEFLDTLPSNHYFSWDYPCDMNPQYEDLFIKKTWENALKYHNHPQYIVTVQYKINHYWNFVEWFDKYNEMEIASNFLGLGNMCKIITKSDFMDHAIDYAFSHSNYKRMHIYGLGLRHIPYVYKKAKQFNIELSIDSTKYTRPLRPLRNWFRKENDGKYMCSNQADRNLFFYFYLYRLYQKKVKIEY